MGTFIENLSITAAGCGMQVKAVGPYSDINTFGNTPVKFVDLEMSPRSVPESLNRELILKRRTSRFHYEDRGLDEILLNTLSAEATAFGHKFQYTTDPSDVKGLIALNEETLMHDLGNDAVRKELDGLFRYSRNEAESKKDGLWSRCFGFPGSMMKTVIRHHDHWDHGVRKKFIDKYYATSLKNTHTIGWYKGPFSNTEDWVRAGHLFARNWLNLTAANVYKQPFGSLITNPESYAKIEKLYGSAPENDQRVWMIFRAGYSKVPPRSYRLETKNFII
jgi:hypothetical protein